ncbi:MAG: HpcH/HpaI aldolase family protein [Bacillota bacterium]
MKNKIEKIIKMIEDDENVIGSSSTFLDSSITEMLADTGYDFIWIDAEHSCLDKKDIMHHIMATRGTDAASFVRIAENDPVLVKPILELKPDGIIFPFIKTAADAREAVQACLYPPEGIRGFGPRRSNDYGLIDIKTYLQKVRKNFWIILLIEHIDAVNNLEAILQVEGFDVIMVGPADLKASLGLLGKNEDDKVNEIMDDIARMTKKHNLILGAVAGNDLKAVQEWIDRGADLIRVGNDVSLLRKAALNILTEINKL